MSFCKVLVFFLPCVPVSFNPSKNSGGEISSRLSSALSFSHPAQDRCSDFQPAKNKASPWLLYFKQERPPTAPNMPMERKNKWLSSWPDTDVQSVSEEEELFGKSHSHPTQVLPGMGLGAPAPPSSKEQHGEGAGMAGDHQSPQPEGTFSKPDLGRCWRREFRKVSAQNSSSCFTRRQILQCSTSLWP